MIAETEDIMKDSDRIYEEDAALDPENAADTGPSFQRASILFVTSFGSLIGASLLIASLNQN